MKVLHGHVSPETAYVVDDYPCGFIKRCKIRYWVETKRGYGMRMVSQTTNPKITTHDVWNKQKSGVYSDFCFLYLDEKNHVQRGGCMRGWPSQAKALIEEVGDQFTAEQLSLLQTLSGVEVS